jgi:hypothetical protein
LNAGGLMQYHAGSGIWYDSARLAVANETLDAGNAGFLCPDSADDQSARAMAVGVGGFRRTRTGS